MEVKNIKLNINYVFVVALIFTLFLGLSLVSANDVNMDDNVKFTDDDIKTTSISNDIDDVEVNENNANENFRRPTNCNTVANDDIVTGANDVLNISSLNNTINSGATEIILEHDYAYDESTDSAFTSGIIINNNLTIDGNGYTIDLGGKIRFLNINSNKVVILKNINVKNGGGNSEAGAIRSEKSHLTIINSNFADNSASLRGGVIYFREGNFTLENCSFSGNTIGSYGGGAVYIYGSNGNITNSKFTGNYANNGGGAVYTSPETNQIKINIIGSSFDDNHATYGGAVYVNTGCNVNLINSNFTANIGSGGGAIYTCSNIEITDVLFSANNATNGGVVYISNTAPKFMNASFTNNHANSGGVVYVTNYGSVNFYNSSFTSNNASMGGVVYIYSGCGATFDNSSFTGNYASSGGVV